MSNLNREEREALKQVQLTEEQQEKFRELRDMIDDITEEYDRIWCDSVDQYDYYFDESDSDQQIANFVRNYRESSAVVKYCFNDSEDQIGAVEIREALGDDDLLVELLLKHSEIEACDDIYIQWNEIDSFIISEWEHQIDVEYHSELNELLNTFTDDELKLFSANTYYSVDRESFYSYGRPCERVILKLDAEAFESAVAEILNERNEDI